MSKTPNHDARIKIVLDDLKPGERVCSKTGEKWLMDDEEIGWYKKFNVPPPTVSPQTRWKYHGLWYVGFQFWYQNHPETNKPIVGTVHPATGIKILSDKEWFNKDFIDQGMTYDSNKSLFAQWRELQLRVPMPACRNFVEPKNSLVFVSSGDEDSYFVGASQTKRTLYSHVAMETEDSAEVYQGSFVRKSFNVIHSSRIFNCRFIRESFDCLNSYFLFDCRNCEFCFGATNQRYKKYLWFNKQLTKEEWEQRMTQVDFGSRCVTQDYFQQFFQLINEQGIWPENFNDSVVNSTGEYLVKTTNVKKSYFCGEGAIDQYFCNFSIGNSSQNAFTGFPVWAHDNYYCASVSRSGDCKFCFLNSQSNNMEYCLLCYNCENCFSCIGLRYKKFCIFNKEYLEEEYWQKVDELKCKMLERGEYGEFFPAAFSPSYYFDSGVFWFGANEEEVKKMGVTIFDPESCGAIGQGNSDSEEIKDAATLPDHISNLSDEWVGRRLFDKVARRHFSLIKPEVEFYRTMKIAPPEKYFSVRLKDLWAEANQGAFETAACAKCSKIIFPAKNTVHSQRRFFCRDCYLRFLEERI